jgi:hypothetical protein
MLTPAARARHCKTATARREFIITFFAIMIRQGKCRTGNARGRYKITASSSR